MENQKLSEIALPVIANPSAGMALITEWKVKEKIDQKKLVDLSLDNMVDGSWPDGLLTYYTYLGNDGVSILHYSHWRSEQDHLIFLEKGISQRLKELNKHDLIKDRDMLGKYRIYKTRAGDPFIIPGCVVIIQEEFESPELTPTWIDTVLEALESEEQLPDGGLSAYFHISLDGKSMLNYAEWTSEKAHQSAMDRSERGTIGISPLWEKVINFPGRRNVNSLKRYTFHRGVVLNEHKNF